MSRVLSSFLIGIGWDTTELEKGSKKIAESMGAAKSTALMTGAALASAAVAIGMAIGHNAVSIDRLNLSLNKMSSSRADVLGLGTAFQLLGGNAADAVSEIDRIEQMMANFRVKGETGALGQLAFIPRAVTERILSAKTGMEFYTRLQRESVGLSKDQARVLQEALGLSDASLKLMQMGSDEFDHRINQGKELNYQTDSLNENARKYNEQWETTKKLVGNVADSITDKMLPGMNQSLGVLNEFITKNKDIIDKIGNFISKNNDVFIVPKAIAAAAGEGVDAVANSRIVKEAVTNANKMTPVIKAKEAYKAGVDLWHAYPQGATPDMRGTGYGPQSMSMASTRAAAGESLANRIGDKVSTAVPSTQPRFVNEVNVHLDGRIIDQQVTEVNARRTKSTLEDLRSTTAR